MFPHLKVLSKWAPLCTLWNLVVLYGVNVVLLGGGLNGIWVMLALIAFAKVRKLFGGGGLSRQVNGRMREMDKLSSEVCLVH